MKDGRKAVGEMKDVKRLLRKLRLELESLLG